MEERYLEESGVPIVMVYEVKKPQVVQENYKALFSSDYSRFYWNSKKFTKLTLGDIVFVVNTDVKTVLFCTLELKDILADYDEGNQQSRFNHRDKSFEVSGQWDSFVSLKILELKDTDDTWRWKTLGSGEHTYLYGNGVSVNSADNNLLRVDQLIGVFSENSEARARLDMCKRTLEELSMQGSSDDRARDFPQKESVTVSTQLSKETQISPSNWLPKVRNFMSANGFDFQLNDIANFYLSMRTKPLLILAGISGTGKTQLVRQFAKAIGYGDERHCVLIPVRPDWADNTDLIGYRNIQGEFEQQRLLQVLLDASLYPDEPFFVILDEMNLARVEHYFSDFLSVLETREWDGEGGIHTSEIVNDRTVNNGSPVTIPQNVVFVGTVNMDETTHPFSRKVLDRANAIEMNDISLLWKDITGSIEKTPTSVCADDFLTPYINSIDLSAKQKSGLKPVVERLVRINNILEPAGLHFGYRVRDEIAFYLSLHKTFQLAEAGIMTEAEALDYQLMQKILPRIQGSSLSVLTAIQTLIKELSGANVNTDMELPEVEKAVAAVEGDTEFPRCIKKLLFMLRRFNDDGFTSFWL